MFVAIIFYFRASFYFMIHEYLLRFVSVTICNVIVASWILVLSVYRKA